MSLPPTTPHYNIHRPKPLMTYKATIELRYDATCQTDAFDPAFTDDSLPEEHYVFTAPAAELNAKQYFHLFEKFLLAVGLEPKAIRSGAMSLVFNGYTRVDEQRKVCDEYELTMEEDLDKKFREWAKRQEAMARTSLDF